MWLDFGGNLDVVFVDRLYPTNKAAVYQMSIWLNPNISLSEANATKSTKQAHHLTQWDRYKYKTPEFRKEYDPGYNNNDSLFRDSYTLFSKYIDAMESKILFAWKVN